MKFDYTSVVLRRFAESEDPMTLQLARAVVGDVVEGNMRAVSDKLWRMDTSPREYLAEALEADGHLIGALVL